MSKVVSKWEPWRDFITQHAGKMTKAEIADAIGTTRMNINNICVRLGIKLPNESAIRKPKPSKWRDALPFIREHANKMPAAEIAAEIGTTTKNVYNICHRNNIRITYDPCEHEGYAVVRRVKRAGLDPFSGTRPRAGRYVGR